MSRFFSDGDGDEQPAHWFQSNLSRAIASKNGQRNLREMAEMMLAMPERTLAYGYLATSAGTACAVGTFAIHRGIDLSKWIDDDGVDPEQTIQVGRDAGLAKALALQLAWMNDERFGDLCTDEQRWAGIYTWVSERVRWQLPVPV